MDALKETNVLHCKVSVEKVKEDVNIVQARSASLPSLSIENGAKTEVAVSKEMSVSSVTHPQ